MDTSATDTMDPPVKDITEPDEINVLPINGHKCSNISQNLWTFLFLFLCLCMFLILFDMMSTPTFHYYDYRTDADGF